jgi:23S rRNA pseudouridine2605 synthase
VDDAMLDRLRQGVELDDGLARFESIFNAGGEGANQWFRVTLKEGRNRIVRRLWESQNIQVSRLMRVRFAQIDLPPRLRARTFMELPKEQVNQLLEFVGLPPEVAPDARTPAREKAATKGRGAPQNQRPGQRRR